MSYCDVYNEFTTFITRYWYYSALSFYKVNEISLKYRGLRLSDDFKCFRTSPKTFDESYIPRSTLQDQKSLLPNTNRKCPCPLLWTLYLSFVERVLCRFTQVSNVRFGFSIAVHFVSLWEEGWDVRMRWTVEWTLRFYKTIIVRTLIIIITITWHCLASVCAKLAV